MRWTGDFPNTERAIVGWLKQELPNEFTVRNEIPADWDGACGVSAHADPGPTVLVERIPGGSSDAENEIGSNFDVTVFTDTVTNLWAAVAVVEKAMAQLPATTFDVVTHPSGFGRVGYANKKVRRAVGGYDITARLR